MDNTKELVAKMVDDGIWYGIKEFQGNRCLLYYGNDDNTFECDLWDIREIGYRKNIEDGKDY